MPSNFRIRVKTSAKEEQVIALPDGRLEISVSEKPQANRANQRVLEILAGYFGVPIKQLRIVSGQTSSSKTISIFK